MEGEMEGAEENMEEVIVVDIAREAILEGGATCERRYSCRTAGNPLWGRDTPKGLWSVSNPRQGRDIPEGLQPTSDPCWSRGK